MIANGTLGSGLDLQINGATVNLNTPSTIGYLEVDGGTLQGTASLTVNGIFSWSGGTIGGNQTLNVKGGMYAFGDSAKQLAGGRSTWRAKAPGISSSALTAVRVRTR